ncbi:MAG: hypothetical protein GY786_07370 [Proteobacteria bacterium]|nr:hypothetical protein [Pseudomonadota bacterium]
MKELLSKSFVLFPLLFSLLSTAVIGNEKHSSTMISYGGYQIANEDSTINGSQLAFSYRYPFSDEIDYFVRFSSEEASGFKSETDGSFSRLTASSLSLKSGLQLNILFEELKSTVPFVQGGVSIISYDYNYTNQKSEIGNTEGLGFGFFGSLGLNIKIGVKTRILPAYHYNLSFIKAAGGNTTSIQSSGMTFAVILSF